jgi:exocyst complex component 3
MVHRNFEQTEEIVNNLLDMSEKLQTLEDMLAADRSDILGGAPNLLAIHYQLTQLEAFRNQTMHQAKKASSESRNTLARCFERLNNLIEAFEELLMELARMILPLVRAGHPEVVVKLVKIAEVEGREDEKVKPLPLSLMFSQQSTTRRQ